MNVDTPGETKKNQRQQKGSSHVTYL